MYLTYGLVLVVLLQTQPPPAKQPPANNPWVPPNGKQLPPEKNQSSNNPPQQPGQATFRPTEPAPPPGNGRNNFSFGPMYQVPVDGTYQVLAYEKFGQMLPGLSNIKVIIRQSIMHFPGDTKTPGKMMRLDFGPNNTIMITPLDGRNDQIPPVNSQPPVINNQNQRGTHLPAGGNKAILPPDQSQPRQPQQDNTGQNSNQSGFVPPSTNSEYGVCVLSGEFFSIAITGYMPVLNNSAQTRNMPDGGPQGGSAPNNQTLRPGQGTDQNGIIPNPPPRRPMPTTGNDVSRASIVLRRIAN